jgi:hypothetical protein
VAKTLRDELLGGNRTSVGNAQQVIAEVLKSPKKLEEIYSLFFDDDPVIVMRSSYVAMRVAEQKPESVEPYKKRLLTDLRKYKQQEIRWHIPQLLMHVTLTKAEQNKAYSQLMEWAETDSSKIVAYYCLPTAAKFASQNPELFNDFVPRLKKLSNLGAKSVSNRCKKIAKELGVTL